MHCLLHNKEQLLRMRKQNKEDLSTNPTAGRTGGGRKLTEEETLLQSF